MKSFKNILWGICLIIIGILIGLKSFDLIDFNIFFDGWWTLFIIVPSFIALFTEDGKIGSFIALFIGVSLLLSCNDISISKYLWKALFPTIIILTGLSCIFKNSLMKRVQEKTKKLNSSDELNIIFNSEKINKDNEEFNGCNVTTIFGGLDIDLRKAIIKEDISINITTIFGGVDIKVPEDVSIKLISNSVFGGIDDKRKGKNNTEKSKTIYINANCIFGGVDIK